MKGVCHGNTRISKGMQFLSSSFLFSYFSIHLSKLFLQEPNIVAQFFYFVLIFLNLVLNAAEAMPDGGKLIISTNYGADHRFIKISVQDTGMGIPKDDLETIFDPFFSTKAPGKGTGLGLAVSYGMVQRHKGTITATSRIGKGSTFEVNLPMKEN